MCGIFGFVGNAYENNLADLSAMKNKLAHRGPDSYDYYTKDLNDNFQLNFGHVRLSIIDVSNAGNQPMHSDSGRYVIVFNGEIYNFLEIKQEIENLGFATWHGASDTEVLLKGIEVFGVEQCISKLVGMFAFALWDGELNKLYLTRDRIGEKPLYYGYQGTQLLFASELKAFEVHSQFQSQINYDAAIGFLLRSCVPQQESIYANVFKVQPGTILEFELSGLCAKYTPEKTTYWSLLNVVKEAKENNYKGTYDEALKELEELLIRSVKSQAISDVPLGAFLSGGIDSSLVCAIYKKHVSSNLHTFTIGMPEPGVNEAHHAGLVAESIGTVHETKYLNTAEITGRIDEIINYWDEPFADSSQIPTFFVSELAKKSVTVSLSGDGADEFAYGYSDYPIYQKFGKLKNLSFFNFNKLLKIFYKLFSVKRKLLILKKIDNFSYLLYLLGSTNNLNEIHAKWRNKFRGEKLPVNKQFLKIEQKYLAPPDHNFKYAGFYDALAYLPDDILVKVDRAAMAVSLESRAPFLDHRVIEFLIRLPDSFKYHDGISKRILKDILYKYVPKEIVNRPKQGFSIPLTYWLRNEIKQWSFEIINSISTNSSFWEKKHVLKLWDDHQNSISDNTESLWNIIVLQNFLNKRNIEL